MNVWGVGFWIFEPDRGETVFMLVFSKEMVFHLTTDFNYVPYIIYTYMYYTHPDVLNHLSIITSFTCLYYVDIKQENKLRKLGIC